jgi:hypothetical protein
LSSGRGITQQISKAFEDLVGGHIVMNGNTPEFQTPDGRVLPMTFLSSGTQELLPLLNVLQRLSYWQEHRIVYNEGARDAHGVPKSPGNTRPIVYVEEPEAHIFPPTQFELIKLFAWLSSDALLDFSWVITTHSPYILSSFNNLLEASQVAASKPNAKGEVAKLVEERYWIKASDFRAYCIREGKLEPIMDEETGLINGSYLDGISNEIGGQFDELLRIGYVEA